jgi:hypothetical protein
LAAFPLRQPSAGRKALFRTAPLAPNAKTLSLKNKTDLAAALNPVSSVRRFCPRFVAL